MIKTELSKRLGIKYPIIQGGMGPYSTNRLCIATANAGALGIISGIGMATNLSDSTPVDSSRVFGQGAPREIMRRTILEVTEETKQSEGIFGVNVPVSSEFVEAARESGASIVGLSGFLTLAFDPMKETIAALKAAGLDVRTMIGGGQIDEQIKEYTGADAYGKDAMAAVSLANEWIGG